jgi:putative endonuclease
MDQRQAKLAAHVLGSRGEDAVAEWYRKAGYEIVDRNWRCREGEIDVIARDDTTLVFCEVKARASTRFADPAAAVGFRKQARVRRAAFRWLEQQAWHEYLRFDVAIVVGGKVTMIEDAF